MDLAMLGRRSEVVLLLVVLLLLPACAVCRRRREAVFISDFKSLGNLVLGNSIVGPESLAFVQHSSMNNAALYTGVSDGRILRWQLGDKNPSGWSEFAFNLKSRNEECRPAAAVPAPESRCGRPLGLQFHNATGNLYIADAYLGLLSVGPKGGLVRVIASGAGGVPFNFTNGLDVDQSTGNVYFTDSSTKFQRSDYVMVTLSGDSTGRLLKYSPGRKELVVLKSGMSFPNGVVVSHDNTHLLIAMTSGCRILRYWIRGPKAGTMDHFAELPGYPDNIKRNDREEYWVAINMPKIQTDRNDDGKEASSEGGSLHRPVAVKLSKEGRVMEVLNGNWQSSVSEVVEKGGNIWMGSVDLPYVGTYKI